MILSNYASYLQTMRRLETTANQTPGITMPNSKRLSDGSNITSFANRAYQNSQQMDNHKFTANNRMRVGAGTADVTPTDWKLDDDISSSCSISLSISDNINLETGKLETLYTAQVQNTSESSITITEVGIVKYLVAYNNNYVSSSDDDAFLYLRHLLQTPIALEPGAIASIVIKWA